MFENPNGQFTKYRTRVSFVWRQSNSVVRPAGRRNPRSRNGPLPPRSLTKTDGTVRDTLIHVFGLKILLRIARDERVVKELKKKKRKSKDTPPMHLFASLSAANGSLFGHTGTFKTLQPRGVRSVGWHNKDNGSCPDYRFFFLLLLFRIHYYYFFFFVFDWQGRLV